MYCSNYICNKVAASEAAQRAAATAMAKAAKAVGKVVASSSRLRRRLPTATVVESSRCLAAAVGTATVRPT